MDDIPLLLGLLVGVTALLAGTLGGITGMSTGIMALPILAFAFGIREAVPIVSVAMLFNMTSRAIANRNYVNYRVVFWYCLGAVPAAAIGGIVFANAPAEILARALGLFLLVLVVWRHLPMAQMARPFRRPLFPVLWPYEERLRRHCRRRYTLGQRHEGYNLRQLLTAGCRPLNHRYWSGSCHGCWGLHRSPRGQASL